MLVVMTTTTAETSAVGQLRHNWGWLLGLGVLFLVLGFIGMSCVVTLTLSSTIVFGILILIGGVAQIIEAFKCTGWKSVLWHVMIAVLYILAAISILMDPAAASILWTAMIAGALVVVGIFRIFIALGNRANGSWVALLLSGLISVLLGGMLFAKWPYSGLWAIGLFVAVELISQGVSLIMLALAAKNA
jgi:uncharacterized membrane protein HdeD (DUF308 family)